MPDTQAGSATGDGRPEAYGVSGRLVLVAGATSDSGLAAARTLSQAGARVVAVGRDAARFDAMRALNAELTTGGLREVRLEVCDLTDESDVAALAERIHAADGTVDGLLHLVGGWRGGGGLAGQSEADYRFLEGSFTALRHVSRAFDADLRTSTAARLAVVSSTAVARPLAGGANYAAVKAATEAWARAVAQGFTKDARDAGTPLAAASVIYRVKSLDGFEQALAQRFADLWSVDAAAVNDTIVELTDPAL